MESDIDDLVAGTSTMRTTLARTEQKAALSSLRYGAIILRQHRPCPGLGGGPARRTVRQATQRSALDALQRMCCQEHLDYHIIVVIITMIIIDSLLCAGCLVAATRNMRGAMHATAQKRCSKPTTMTFA